ncbi:hypothetical protein CHARACLAT_023363 [Characodon lateralis]|uniref:Uncharacterized protein n=2 Tax=Goodeidae TaxID=28758 RepID=A0ABU7BVB4_9TELE|nr:hypothetical protein [Ataeniobius toweri]MED6271732.1 hypothetical protein [Characodon lateralis]
MKAERSFKYDDGRSEWFLTIPAAVTSAEDTRGFIRGSTLKGSLCLISNQQQNDRGRQQTRKGHGREETALHGNESTKL